MNFRYMSQVLAQNLILTISVCLFSVAGCQLAAQPAKDKFETNLNYLKFLNPPAEFRSFPFFSINDSLDAKEIELQVREFKKAGFGGFYLHSRDGLLTDFLGDEWWTIMDAAVDAAQATGIQAMFYDEDKWPSGYAGGIIPRMGEVYRAKSLARIRKDIPLPIGAVVLKEDAQYKYIQHTAQMGNPVFNGTCWVDLFNPVTVKQFLEVAYHPYIEKYSRKITSYQFAIFADEPHIHARYFDKATPNEGILSYSPWVAKKFRERNGYDLMEKVNLLFEEKENWREVRLNYYRAVAEQFDESFTRQVSAYCAKNGVKFTGHFLGEDGLEKVRDRIGNSMLHYRSMQQPGIDHLGLSIANRLLTARSLSSVANQYAIARRLSEMFGTSGQNMNFEDRKWIAGWHAILGINHFCPHLTLYSMKGLRKRDYPPTFSYQQPYWLYNKKIEDYMGRIAYAATIGQYAPQLLVINPLESEYAKGNGDGDFTDGVQNVMEILQKEHYDYDLGDEQIIADTARIKGNRLIIGAMTYLHVLLPDMISIRETTLDLLLKLHQNGGLILSVGRFPALVDGVTGNKKLEQLKTHTILTDIDNIAAVLKSKIKPEVILSGKDAAKVWTQVRNLPNGKMVLFYNTSHTNPARFSAKMDLSGKNLTLWEPSSGKCYSIFPDQTNFCIIELPPSGVVWISDGKLRRTAPLSGVYRLPEPCANLLELKNDWQGKRLVPNALTLDFAEYSIDNGMTCSEPEPVTGIFTRLSKQNYSGNLQLRFLVQVDTKPSKCQLVLEQPEQFRSIQINRKNYAFKPTGFFVDHQFKTSDITGYLQNGKNTIQLELTFKPAIESSAIAKERYGTEIESIYLTGDFAVVAHETGEKNDSQRNRAGTFQLRSVHQAKSYSIASEKEIVSGDVSMDGYPFYTGKFELNQSFNLSEIGKGRKYFLELPNCEAIASVIELNGIVVDTLCWAPFKTEITYALKTGRNELKIVMVNSLRNLLGPHHNSEGELIKVGPASFTGAGGFPGGAGDANWYDLRKTGKKLKIWTDTYHFIPFGLLEPARISVTTK